MSNNSDSSWVDDFEVEFLPGVPVKLPESAKQKILQKMNEARQERVGDALEIKVPKETMRFVMSKIKLKDETIAKRTLEPLWLVKKWRDGTADTYDLEVEIWVLRILASLANRFNWSIFLIKPENLPKYGLKSLESKGE